MYESFWPGRFGLGRFGLFLGWVVSDYFGGSFRPNSPPPLPQHYKYNINETALFVTSHTSMCKAEFSKESYRVLS